MPSQPLSFEHVYRILARVGGFSESWGSSCCRQGPTRRRVVPPKGGRHRPFASDLCPRRIRELASAQRPRTLEPTQQGELVLRPAKNFGPLTYEQLRHIGQHAMDNGADLSAESRLLLDHGYHARAFGLSVLAVEEAGKAFTCAVWAGRQPIPRIASNTSSRD